MTITPSQMRENFSEFASVARYPDELLQFWLNVAYLMLNATKWSTMLDLGAQLFAAHNVAIERRAQDEARRNGVPGISTGPVSAKSVDKTSLSYASSDALEQDAGHWNLTIYGTRLKRLIDMFGAGPFQAGVGCVPPFTFGAWSGPPFWPGWYMGT